MHTSLLGLDLTRVNAERVMLMTTRSFDFVLAAKEESGPLRGFIKALAASQARSAMAVAILLTRHCEPDMVPELERHRTVARTIRRCLPDPAMIPFPALADLIAGAFLTAKTACRASGADYSGLRAYIKRAV